MTYTTPITDSKWHRKSDMRVDVVKGCDGKWVLMYSPITNRHWHVQIQNFYRKYIEAEESSQ